MPVEPYLRANAWRTFGGYDTVTYNSVDHIKSEHKSSTADLGVGVVAKLSSTVSVYLAIDYNTNLDSNELDGISGNLGVRVSWQIGHPHWKTIQRSCHAADEIGNQRNRSGPLIGRAYR
ncbi:autotransporter outer membrane beta-barrel domain-containing protein [Pseudomonas sp. EL_65y_Pfl2_R96]|uniref:autotransporter outer membrane beta-barrel domain-containing protein n=1 Tax=Pseudomonas sp. EL_65y_Pfl2_R96 TaxID=3088699 RepID=UPI0030D74D7B